MSIYGNKEHPSGLLQHDAPSTVTFPAIVASPATVASPTTVTATTSTVTAATVITTTNTISPPVLPAVVEAFAPTRTILLPSDYVPRRPRNAFILFRGQFNQMMKQSASGKSNTQHEISAQARDAWDTLSQAQRKIFETAACEENDRLMQRFPTYKYLKKERLDYAVEWSVDTDDLFIINDDGTIQYGPAIGGSAPRRRRRAKRASKKDAPAPRKATPEAAVEESAQPGCFSWQLETGGSQDTPIKDLPLPYLPYLHLPSAPSQEVVGFSMDWSASAGPSSGPFPRPGPFDYNAPMNPFLGHDFLLPSDPTMSSALSFLESDPTAMNYAISSNDNQFTAYPQPATRSLLEWLYSDDLYL
ncbi:hypothetical protein BDZ89DRAFT_1215436 [Hymenopellis radicata]|nr:hypothetical protein BDZ89DRAFT_1215436 [Hymenopellis radicata]